MNTIERGNLLDTTNLTPVFATKDGNPFVFLERQPITSCLFIKHGSNVTVFLCVPSYISSGDPKLYNRGKAEIKIYGHNGRPVASLLPAENVLVIKRDGDFNIFDLEDLRIYAYATVPVEGCTLFADNLNFMFQLYLQRDLIIA